MDRLIKMDAFEAATAWFDEHFNGLPTTDSLVLGVLHAFAAELTSAIGATEFVDAEGRVWLLVPKDPTPEMQYAGLKSLDNGGLGECDCDQVSVWNAMVDKAPKRAAVVASDDLVGRLRADDASSLSLEAANRIEALTSRIAELEGDLEISDAEGNHAFALAVDDPGKNPPELWRDIAERLKTEQVFDTAEDARNAQAMLLKADRFYFGKNTYGYDVWVASRSEGVWAVWSGSSCYSRNGFWLYEPLPSNREHDYISETRFTFAEAVKMAEEALVAPRPEFPDD